MRGLAVRLRSRFGAIGSFLGALLLLLSSGVGAQAAASAPWSALAASGTAVVALPPDVPLNGFAPMLSAFTATVYNAQTNFLMYQPLLYVDGHDNIDFSRSLAQSVTVSGDDTVYTVHLNPKWHWSNGEPVTSADVAYDASLLMAACSPKSKLPYAGCGFGGLPGDWKSVTTAGPYTVVFRVRQPVNPVWFEHNGLAQLMPFPQRIWQKYRDPQKELAFINRVMDDPGNPVYRVVDGPFFFKRYVNNEFWEFVPNPRYSGHKATIRRLIYQFFASDTAEFAALRQGTVSVGYLTATTLQDKGQLKGYRFNPVYCLCVSYLAGNFSPKTPQIGAAFRDLKVRQAIQMAIDGQAYIRLVGNGYGVPTWSPVPPLPRVNIYLPNELPKPYPFDPRAGRRLLEQDGWRDIGGVMEKHGVRLSFPFLYPSGSQAITNFVTLLKGDLAEEGIQITPVAEPLGEIMATANDMASPANASRWVMAWPGAWAYQPDYYPTGGGLFTPSGRFNYGGFDDPHLTQLIRATYAPGTPYQSMLRMTAYLAYAAKDLPVWYLPSIPGFMETAAYLHGVQANLNPVAAINLPNYWTIAH